MLKIKISAVKPQDHRTSTDISHLWAAKHLEMRLLPALGRKYETYLIYVAVATIVCCLLYLICGWLYADGPKAISDYRQILPLVGAATICLGLATLILWHNRFSELIRTRIYCLDPGQQFPFITHRAPGLGHYRTDIAARTTEPNVKARLERIFNRCPAKPIVIAVSDESAYIDKLKQLSLACKRCTCLPKTSEKLSPILEYGNDFWPIARFVVSRLLYTPIAPSNNEAAHSTRSYQSVEIRKGRHLWFAFVTHRAYVAGWLLMTAAMMVAVAYSNVIFHIDTGKSSLQLPLTLSFLPILWCLWASRGHRYLMNQWRNWADHWSNHPLGNLPLFLAGASKYEGWEELSSESSQIDIVDFGLDSTSMLSVATTVFLIAALSLLMLIK